MKHYEELMSVTNRARNGAQDSARSGANGGRTLRVLVADDSAAMRTMLRYALQLQGGFEIVAEAADGTAVLDLVSEHHPDVVLLDVSMPGLDGITVLPEIRRRCPGTRVVVLSGHDDDGLRAAAMAGGAHRYLVKGELSLMEIAAALREPIPAAATRPGWPPPSE